MIILKATKKQDFFVSPENIFLEKPRGALMLYCIT